MEHSLVSLSLTVDTCTVKNSQHIYSPSFHIAMNKQTWATLLHAYMNTTTILDWMFLLLYSVFVITQSGHEGFLGSFEGVGSC